MAVLALAAGMTAAQLSDPRALLDDISAAEKAADGWRAEGAETNELTGEGMNIKTQHRFTAVVKDATHMKWEITGEPSTLTVCDGAEHWSYSQPGLGFRINPVDFVPCSSPLPRFDNLTENMTNATVTGTEQALFDGNMVNCTVVKAEYKIPAAKGAGGIGSMMIRTLCVDAERKLILKEKAEAWNAESNVRSTRTTTFNTYQRGPELAAGEFTFEVPTGTYLDPGPQSGEGASAVGADGSHRFGDGVISPVLVVKTEPAGNETGVSGLVLVSLTVDAEGKPRDVAVERRLGHGLDEKALEAVSQWRFRPGLSFGAPVAVRELVVAVDFRKQ